MPCVDLLSVLGQETDLDGFAKTFFETAKLPKYEERESTSHVGGYYFRTEHGEFKFTVSMSDEVDHRDLYYWIQVTNRILEAEDLVGFVDQLARNVMLPVGFRVARVIDLGKKNEQRIDY